MLPKKPTQSFHDVMRNPAGGPASSCEPGNFVSCRRRQFTFSAHHKVQIGRMQHAPKTAIAHVTPAERLHPPKVNKKLILT